MQSIRTPMQRNVSGRVFVIKQGLSRAGLDSENRLGLIYLWETWKQTSKNSALLNTQSQKIATRRVAVIAMLSSPRCCAEDSLRATIEAFLPIHKVIKVQARCCNQTKKVLMSDVLSHTWMVQLIQPRNRCFRHWRCQIFAGASTSTHLLSRTPMVDHNFPHFSHGIYSTRVYTHVLLG